MTSSKHHHLRNMLANIDELLNSQKLPSIAIGNEQHHLQSNTHEVFDPTKYEAWSRHAAAQCILDQPTHTRRLLVHNFSDKQRGAFYVAKDAWRMSKEASNNVCATPQRALRVAYINSLELAQPHFVRSDQVKDIKRDMLDINLEKKRKEDEENSKYRRRILPTVRLPGQNWKFDKIVDNVEIKQFMERFSIKTTALHAELENVLDIDLPIHNFLPWYMETTIRWWHENASRGQVYTPSKFPNRVFVRTERSANGKDRTFYIGRDTWRVTNLPGPITAIQSSLITNVLTNNIMNTSSTVELLSAFISATNSLEASFHRCHLVQTDISPNNILLDSNGEGVVNDYDFILN